MQMIKEFKAFALIVFATFLMVKGMNSLKMNSIKR